MKKTELKAALKPLIKECIKEVMFEEGVLSSVIQEVVKGTSAQVVTEAKQTQAPAPEIQRAVRPDPTEALARRKKALMGAIGSDAFNGIDLFEGTTPTPSTGTTVAGTRVPSVLGEDAGDPGVDISGLFAAAGGSWDALAKGNKK